MDGVTSLRGGRRWLVAAAITLASGTTCVAAEQTRAAFRVCADPNYMPYSNERQEGFENKVAALLAAELGLPVEYTWFPQRMGFIRNTLRAEAQGGGYKCDVVMGVPKGYELAITTTPYYHSVYALVYVKGRGLDDVASSDDVLRLEPARRAKLRFGLGERNPGTLWLAKHGMLDQLSVAYRSQHGNPAVRPGEEEQRDLVAGQIDMTVMWGPIAGHFARSVEGLEVAVVPLRSEPDLRLHFGISAGVRFGEKAWRDQLQALLDKNSARIAALLASYGVPLVGEDGAPL